MTGSVCLDRFIVETDLLSASTNTQAQNTTSDAKLNTTSMRNTVKWTAERTKDRNWGRGKEWLYFSTVCMPAAANG